MKPYGIVYGTLAAAIFAATPALGAESEAGLPQLDPTFYPGELFWLAISFTLLYVVMAKFALPSVQTVLTKRHGAVQGDLEAAAEASKIAKELKVEQEKALAEARAKARAIVGEVAVALSKDGATAQAAQQEALHARVREAEQKIAAERDAVLKEVPQVAKALAQDVIGAVTGLGGRAA